MEALEKLKSEVEGLLQPSDALLKDMEKLDGDILILGVGGKVGPSLAKLAVQSFEKLGKKNKVIGVSRFSEKGLQEELEGFGVRTHKADLLNKKDMLSLPDAPNVIYLAGVKFGTQGNEGLTWAMNSYLPGEVSARFKKSKIVVYSTGNVYPFMPVYSGGADEGMAPAPIGEYAQSCLGRERIFEYFSKKNNTPMLIFRLNYANDLRYGILLEVAKSVYKGESIDVRMGNVNVIWQGDSNEATLRSLLHCTSPANFLNITGPETVSIRWMANQFGKLFDKESLFTGEEQTNGILSNASKYFDLFGYPHVTLRKMIELTALWLKLGGETINKPTHFQERKGNY